MCGDTKYGKGAATKCVGMQNMARGLPQSVWGYKIWQGGCHKVCGDAKYGKGAATKCVGIQNMARGAATKCVGM